MRVEDIKLGDTLYFLSDEHSTVSPKSPVIGKVKIIELTEETGITDKKSYVIIKMKFEQCITLSPLHISQLTLAVYRDDEYYNTLVNDINTIRLRRYEYLTKETSILHTLIKNIIWKIYRKTNKDKLIPTYKTRAQIIQNYKSFLQKIKENL